MNRWTRTRVWAAACAVALVASAATAGTGPQLQLLGSYQLQGDPTVPPAGPRENDPSGCAITSVGGTPKAWVAVRGGADIGLHVFDLSAVPTTQSTSIRRPLTVVGRPAAVAGSDAADAVAITYYDSTTLVGNVLVYRASDESQISAFRVYPGTDPLGVTNPAGVAILDANILVVTDAYSRAVRGWYYRDNGTHHAGDPTGAGATTYGTPSDLIVATLTINSRPSSFALVLEPTARRVEAYPLAAGRPRTPLPPLRTTDEPGGMFLVGTDTSTVRLYVTQPASNRILIFRSGAPLSPITGSGIDGPAHITGFDDGTNVSLYVTSVNRACISYLHGPSSAPLFVNFAEPVDSTGGMTGIITAPNLPAAANGAHGQRVVVPVAWQDAVLDLGRTDN
jgi:hypothetical protein